MSKNVLKCLRISANVPKCQKMSSDISEFQQMSPKMSRNVKENVPKITSNVTKCLKIIKNFELRVELFVLQVLSKASSKRQTLDFSAWQDLATLEASN